MRCKQIISSFILLALLLSLAACGKQVGGYHTIDAGLEDRVLSIGCREGDPLMDILIAALQVRTADGTVAQLSQSWFGRDVTQLKGDANALAGLELPEPRVLIVGYEPGSLPFSGTNADGKAEGFEIELAQSVCELLGWEMRTLAIDPVNAATELASGNVDCVWGGAGLAGYTGLRAMTYIQTEYVLISRADNPVKRVSALEGKAMSYPPFAGAAAAGAGLLDKPDTAAKLADTAACLTALDAGRCDAVLTDALTAAYYQN